MDVLSVWSSSHTLQINDALQRWLPKRALRSKVPSPFIATVDGRHFARRALTLNSDHSPMIHTC